MIEHYSMLALKSLAYKVMDSREQYGVQAGGLQEEFAEI